MFKKILISLFIFFFVIILLPAPSQAQKLLILMDLSQTDHLKAYGVAYWCLKQGYNVEWLLNYRAGSFMADYREDIADRCRLQEVSFKKIDLSQAGAIYKEIEENNMDVVLLEKAPAIAVYVPPNKEPWDDAVRLALAYAESPYKTLWDEEVLKGELEKYDWLHLHHEDFTGQYGKFYGTFRNEPW
ncbi:MAG: asparagine synthetase B, partial [candidate division Zixibacteria bacterium]|nr:asparagine synthetase B [candidate division Zixibacteria bacterium]